MVWLLAALTLATAILVDVFFGEPKGKLLKAHPVVFTSYLCKRFSRPYSQKIHGLFSFSFSVFPCVLIYSFPHYISLAFLPLPVAVLVSSFILKTTFSINLLHKIVEDIYKALNDDQLSRARKQLQNIVRRNTQELNEELIVSATIESLFESLVDGYTSPLFYYVFLGIPGSLFQRAANTMDSLVGYTTPDYKDEGYFSAKIDTALNYVPARLTSLLIVLAAAVAGFDWINGFKILVRDRNKTPSLNAGWPMSAAAGTLKITLLKKGCYQLGEPIKELNQERIREALTLYRITTILATALYFLIIYLMGLIF